MKRNNRSLRPCLAFAAILAVCSACSQSSVDLEPSIAAGGATSLPAAQQPLTRQPAPLAGLPGLAGLPQSAPRSSSYVESDLERSGEQFESGLPNAGVTVYDSPILNFSPANPGPTNGLNHAAFAVFHFNAPEYDRDDTVHLNWVENPADPDLIWVGFSNWEADCWDWYQHQPGGYVRPADLNQYFNPAGDLYLAIMVNGFFQTDLENIHLGGPAPAARLEAQPPFGPAPLNVNFDASESGLGTQVITKYEWDLDGDGIYESETEEPTIQHEYTAEGTHSAAVRVTNQLGNTGVESLQVEVGPYWQRSLGLPKADYFDAAAVDSDDNVYLVGSSFIDPSDVDFGLLIVSLNKLGTLRWAARYRSAPEDAFARCVAVDSDNNIVVGGTELLPGGDWRCLVQKWSSGGGLLWSKNFGSGSSCGVEDLRVHGTDIYFCGSVDSDLEDMLAGRLTGDGALVWAQRRGDAAWDLGSTLDLKYNLIGQVSGMTVLGYHNTMQLDQQLWKVDYSSNGNFVSGKVLDDSSGKFQAASIDHDYNFFNDTVSYSISGTVESGDLVSGFMLQMPEDGASTMGFKIDGLDFFYDVPSLRRDGVGGFYLSGGSFVGSGPSGEKISFLLHMDSVGQLLSSSQLRLATSYVGTKGLIPYQDGLLLWGHSPDSSPEWSTLNDVSLQPYSASWSDLDASGEALSWTTVNGLGSKTDITQDLVQDSGGGGGFDALALYRPLPE